MDSLIRNRELHARQRNCLDKQKEGYVCFLLLAIRRFAGMQALKKFPKKEIYGLDHKDVLEYLMFRDENDSEEELSYITMPVPMWEMLQYKPALTLLNVL